MNDAPFIDEFLAGVVDTAAVATAGQEQVAHFDLTDAGNGDRFVSRHGAGVRFVPAWGWLVWTGTHWARNDLLVRSRMIETARAIHREAAMYTNVEAQKAVSRWARESQAAGRVRAALWCAQPELVATTDQFDAEDFLLTVKNGTIDLRSGELLPHRREDFLTRMSPIVYDPGAPCPTWDGFLARVLPDPGLTGFLQRFAGYTLTGSTREQVLLFLYGSGWNGKTVFLETIASLLGDHFSAASVDVFTVKQSGGIPNDVAALAGARMVGVSEVGEGSRMNEGLIKDTTGGDTITARFLHREYFSFRPKFKLWIRGNHKPQIRGTDTGIWRRLMLVPFRVQIPESEIDPDLPDRLRGELPGILAWAVRGCLDWQKSGLRTPQAVRAAVSDYRAEMDTLGEFIGDRCIVAGHVEAKAADLYASYREWCASAGIIPLSQTRFGTALGERGFEKIKSGTVAWLGISLLDHESRTVR